MFVRWFSNSINSRIQWFFKYFFLFFYKLSLNSVVLRFNGAWIHYSYLLWIKFNNFRYCFKNAFLFKLSNAQKFWYSNSLSLVFNLDFLVIFVYISYWCFDTISKIKFWANSAQNEQCSWVIESKLILTSSSDSIMLINYFGGFLQ